MIPRAICIAVLAVFAVLPTAGCGTVANLAHTRPEDGGRVPFGGVKRDLETLHQPESGVYPRQALAVFSALDLPFSFVGDVLTWPYTAAYSFINEPVPTPAVVVADTTSPASTVPPAVIPKSIPVPKPAAEPTVPPADVPKLSAAPDVTPKPRSVRDPK